MIDPQLQQDQLEQAEAFDAFLRAQHRESLEAAVQARNALTRPLVGEKGVHVLTGTFRTWRFGIRRSGDLYYLSPGNWVFVAPAVGPGGQPYRLWQVADRLHLIKGEGGGRVDVAEVLEET
jgi:hypothetical protein